MARGTSLYQPPEVRYFIETDKTDQLNYSVKEADIWSLGVNMFMAMGFRPPYMKLQDTNFDLIRRGNMAGLFQIHEMEDLPLELH